MKPDVPTRSRSQQPSALPARPDDARRRPRWCRALARFAAGASLLGIVGCAAPSGQQVIHVGPGDYPLAFDAAVEALRHAGYVTAVRDRASGVIESEPLRIAGALEPWSSVRQPWSTTAESTISLQRRRARVEFARRDAPNDTPNDTRYRVEPSKPRSEMPLDGADVVGATTTDLRGHPGATQMRVSVSIERAHTPGIRRFLWTRALTTRFIDPAEPIDPADGVVTTSVWTPIGRDDDAERRLVDRIRAALETG